MPAGPRRAGHDRSDGGSAASPSTRHARPDRLPRRRAPTRRPRSTSRTSTAAASAA
ncbi:MAG: hypothetical protein M0C28_23300 [Candidatus Moduliflexus flocculans]|nr:hypothetical protein [Candidatus Moduliflexus flocculans]